LARALLITVYSLPRWRFRTLSASSDNSRNGAQTSAFLVKDLEFRRTAADLAVLGSAQQVLSIGLAAAQLIDQNASAIARIELTRVHYKIQSVPFREHNRFFGRHDFASRSALGDGAAPGSAVPRCRSPIPPISCGT
jgi:hypothetical protein